MDQCLRFNTEKKLNLPPLQTKLSEVQLETHNSTQTFFRQQKKVVFQRSFDKKSEDFGLERIRNSEHEELSRSVLWFSHCWSGLMFGAQQLATSFDFIKFAILLMIHFYWFQTATLYCSELSLRRTDYGQIRRYQLGLHGITSHATNYKNM